MCNAVCEFSSLTGCLCCINTNLNVSIINSKQPYTFFKDMDSPCSFHVSIGLYSYIQKKKNLSVLSFAMLSGPFQHCVYISFTFLEKPFHHKNIPSEAVVWPWRGYLLVPMEKLICRAFSLQSVFSLVPRTAGVLPPLSTVAVFLEHNTRKGNRAGVSGAEIGEITY